MDQLQALKNKEMKKYIFIIAIGSCLLTGILFSCKHLDEKPDNLLTSDILWSNRANAESYLYNIYGSILEIDYSHQGTSDEASISIPSTSARRMAAGDWSPVNAHYDHWDNYYRGIRSSFIFEANVDKVPESQLSSALKAQYKAESKFLRGWFYWQLIKQYGPVVKLTGPLALDADFNTYPRATFDDCKNYTRQLVSIQQLWPPIQRLLPGR
jgi:hypothetical protein